MKNRAFVLSLVLALTLTGTPSAARAEYQEGFVSGREWVRQMSPREKFMSLLPPAILFSSYDVRLRHSLPQYIHRIDAILATNPQLHDEEIGNVFASTVFLLEPENRDKLSAMESDFLRGDYRPGRLEVPRLRIDLPEQPFRSE